ncbi:hypothetical protein D3H35_11240 [Cohnella faecalis]|uniref:Molybdopterin dehydrogenase FAD-binding domain-containing protein n=1 Tax=Cohnella faecalis TaxID=2315694 RepID=A0A398CTS7_9BACL|nr:hypothetical protein D3H35_11240 [Cohnella faecalis]
MSNIHGSSFRYPEVWRPADPAEAWQWKRRFGAEAAFAAGATWLRTQWEAGSLPMPSYLIDLSAVKELTGIKVKHNRLTIGALTSLAQVRSSAEVLANAPALTAAAAAIAAHSIRQLRR